LTKGGCGKIFPWPLRGGMKTRTNESRKVSGSPAGSRETREERPIAGPLGKKREKKEEAKEQGR